MRQDFSLLTSPTVLSQTEQPPPWATLHWSCCSAHEQPPASWSCFCPDSCPQPEPNPHPCKHHSCTRPTSTRKLGEYRGGRSCPNHDTSARATERITPPSPLAVPQASIILISFLSCFWSTGLLCGPLSPISVSLSGPRAGQSQTTPPISLCQVPWPGAAGLCDRDLLVAAEATERTRVLLKKANLPRAYNVIALVYMT